MVSPKAEVFHKAANRWLPVEVHPDYQAGVSGKHPALPLDPKKATSAKRPAITAKRPALAPIPGSSQAAPPPDPLRAAFAATNAGVAPVVANITVTPEYTFGAVTCTGTPQVFTITVQPTPTVTAVGNQSVCNGANTTAINFTGAVAGTTYNWVNDNASIGLAASGSGNIGVFAATNTGSTVVVSTITVTPVINGCAGTPTNFTITVNPTPTVADPAEQVVCNGANTTAITFTGAVGGTTYNWTNDTPAIGLAASGSGNIAAFAPANVGIVPVVATTTVTTVFAGCNGTPPVFTITVQPTPTVVDPADQVLCNGANTTAVTYHRYSRRHDI